MWTVGREGEKLREKNGIQIISELPGLDDSSARVWLYPSHTGYFRWPQVSLVSVGLKPGAER